MLHQVDYSMALFVAFLERIFLRFSQWNAIFLSDVNLMLHRCTAHESMFVKTNHEMCLPVLLLE